MDPNTFPTKGNLIKAKNSLALSRQGFDLMDKKRNILIREMMELVDQAKDVQSQIDPMDPGSRNLPLGKGNNMHLMPLGQKVPAPFLYMRTVCFCKKADPHSFFSSFTTIFTSSSVI